MADIILSLFNPVFDEDNENVGGGAHTVASSQAAAGYVLSDAIFSRTQAGGGTLLNVPSAPAIAADAGMNPAFIGSNDEVAVIPASGDPDVDGSLRGAKWADGAITYSDPDAPADYQATYRVDADSDGVSAQNEGFSQLTAQQLVAVHFALTDAVHTQPAGAAGFSVAGFTNLDIDYDGPGVGTGTIRIANSSDARTAYAFYPGTFQSAGDVWLGPSIRTPVAGNYGWFGVMHELGHSLGLKHGHEDFGFGALPADVNSLEFSLMTYSTYVGQSPIGSITFEPWGAPQTYMMLDIATLQYMYGADYTINSADTVYTWSPVNGETFVNGNLAIDPGGNRIFATIWDGGGSDTYDLSNYTTGVTIDLGPGDYSIFSTGQLARLGGGPNGGFARGNIFNALEWNGDARSLIENATGGSGDDTLTGSAIGNRLIGNAGNDVLSGEAGDDWIEGEAGSSPLPAGTAAGADTISGGTGHDTVLAGGGNDVVHGDSGNDTIIGEAGDDVLYGDAGFDAIDGGDGGDVLYGGTEADILFGAADGDTLYGGEGDDIMMGERGVDNALGVLDILYGEGGNDLMHGGGGNDWIFGADGADVIDGGYGSDLIVAGPGADIMLGSGASEFTAARAGNDLFVLTSMADAGDRIWGFDTRPGDADGIDLRVLFDGMGYTGVTPRLDGVLSVSQGATPTDAVVSIDPNGGGDSFSPLLTLHGVTPATLTDAFFLFQ